jgi:dihydroxyacid dehydratase/phosphogluconate dehydratase
LIGLIKDGDVIELDAEKIPSTLLSDEEIAKEKPNSNNQNTK